jgi:hypothetical protein
MRNVPHKIHDIYPKNFTLNIVSEHNNNPKKREVLNETVRTKIHKRAKRQKKNIQQNQQLMNK